MVCEPLAAEGTSRMDWNKRNKSKRQSNKDETICIGCVQSEDMLTI